MLMKRAFLVSVLFLSSSNCIFADAEAPANAEEIANPTETFLTTIFLGDTQRTYLYLQDLARSYENLIKSFIFDDYCSAEFQPTAVASACLEVQKSEADLLKKGHWTKGFQLKGANFNHSIDGKNIGTYNFAKPIKDLGNNYKCEFRLLLEAVLNNPPSSFMLTRELSFDCERVK